MHGTGTEDYFNGGWYALKGRWDTARSLPLYGCLGYSMSQGWSGGYRLMLSDKVPFEKGIYQAIEHGQTAVTGVPVYYQARAYQKNRFPKYLGPTPKPAKLLATWGTAPSPTLTEDLLSAMKVGLVGEGCAVLGTSASSHLVATLLKRARPVNVWLDPDEAGQRGARKLCKQLRAYGLTVRNIQSTKDPKLHTRSEIKEYLDV
jgi:hypothetical protein